MINALSNFFGVLVKGCGVLFLAQFGAAQFDSITESRFYRDLYGLTPFYGVHVHYIVPHEGSVSVGGEMIKRRCEYADLHAFATFYDSPRRRALLSTAAEDALGVVGNRKPSTQAETWGPWTVFWPTDKPQPDEWEIYASHWCPVLDANGNEIMNQRTGEPRMKYETNLFARGNWVTTNEAAP